MRQFDLGKDSGQDRVQSSLPKSGEALVDEVDKPQTELNFAKNANAANPSSTTQNQDHAQSSAILQTLQQTQQPKQDPKSERKFAASRASGGRADFNVDEELRKLNLTFDIHLKEEKDEKRQQGVFKKKEKQGRDSKYGSPIKTTKSRVASFVDDINELQKKYKTAKNSMASSFIKDSPVQKSAMLKAGNLSTSARVSWSSHKRSGLAIGGIIKGGPSQARFSKVQSNREVSTKFGLNSSPKIKEHKREPSKASSSSRMASQTKKTKIGATLSKILERGSKRSNQQKKETVKLALSSKNQKLGISYQVSDQEEESEKDARHDSIQTRISPHSIFDQSKRKYFQKEMEKSKLVNRNTNTNTKSRYLNSNNSRNEDAISESKKSTHNSSKLSFTKMLSSSSGAQGQGVLVDLGKKAGQHSARSSKLAQIGNFGNFKTRPNSKSNSQLHSRKTSIQPPKEEKQIDIQFIFKNAAKPDTQAGSETESAVSTHQSVIESIKSPSSVQKKNKIPRLKNIYYTDDLIAQIKSIAMTPNSIEFSKESTSEVKVSELISALGENQSSDTQREFYDHFLASLQSLEYIERSEKPNDDEIIGKKVYLPPKRENIKKTLIFDLDETLIHCNEDPSAPSDIRLPIKFSGGEVIEASICVRPFAKEIIVQLSQYYEIVIFTASHACYANIVLNILDPQNKYISYRLFREHCHKTKEGIFVKDLRVISNRDLKDILIVDNYFYSYGFQMLNGVPIIPYYNNKSDTELRKLAQFLIKISDVEDVRVATNAFFFLSLLKKHYRKPPVLTKAIIVERQKM